MIVNLDWVEIQIRDLIETLADDMREFRGEEFRSFDETGQSDLGHGRSAGAHRVLDGPVAEQNRINRALIKAMLRYLMLNTSSS